VDRCRQVWAPLLGALSLRLGVRVPVRGMRVGAALAVFVIWLFLRDVQAAGFSGIVLAHNARSEAEVDDVIATAEGAGATVTRRPAKTFYGGYAGFFTDLDGHVWEIAHNPGFPLADDGSISIPEFSKA